MINDLDLHETSFRGRSLSNIQRRGRVYTVMIRSLNQAATISRTGVAVIVSVAFRGDREEHL
jgi:hypothetical protein